MMNMPQQVREPRNMPILTLIPDCLLWWFEQECLSPHPPPPQAHMCFSGGSMSLGVGLEVSEAPTQALAHIQAQSLSVCGNCSSAL